MELLYSSIVKLVKNLNDHKNFQTTRFEMSSFSVIPADAGAATDALERLFSKNKWSWWSGVDAGPLFECSGWIFLVDGSLLV